MQFAPDAAVLLAAVGRLLDEQVLTAVPPELQHQVRVAGHLVHLVEREQRLAPDAERRERELLIALLRDLVDHIDVEDTATLHGALADLLRQEDDQDFERRAWPVLVAIARLDLAVAKPGHDAWEGD